MFKYNLSHTIKSIRKTSCQLTRRRFSNTFVPWCKKQFDTSQFCQAVSTASRHLLRHCAELIYFRTYHLLKQTWCVRWSVVSTATLCRRRNVKLLRGTIYVITFTLQTSRVANGFMEHHVVETDAPQ